MLDAAIDHGVTFLDTADVYGDGRSERACGALHERHPGVLIATKMGRRVPQLAGELQRRAPSASGTRARARTSASRRLDLVQLHCPPDAVYADDTVFEALDAMVEEDLMRAYGVSVETCEQALAAIARPRVASVQIILNCLRLKPLEQVLPAARAAGVAIIARVPLASGLLSGRYDEHTVFASDDHRRYNRLGEAFDVGETFSGVPYDVGLAAVRELARARRPRRHARAVRAALGDRPARRHDGHPRRPQPAAGRRQRRRRRARRRFARSSSRACATSTTG